MDEAMGLKTAESRSPTMASPPFNISSKSMSWFRSYLEDTHRQTDDLISLLSFLESGLKTHAS
jgi:hypothetical protein